MQSFCTYIHTSVICIWKYTCGTRLALFFSLPSLSLSVALACFFPSAFASFSLPNCLHSSRRSGYIQLTRRGYRLAATRRVVVPPVCSACAHTCMGACTRRFALSVPSQFAFLNKSVRSIGSLRSFCAQFLLSISSDLDHVSLVSFYRKS